jgi:hypothetical protein
MSFPKHHGITLANGSWIENLHVEKLASDPITLTASRIWHNTTDRVVKFTLLDGVGAVVVRTISTAEDLAAAIATLNTAISDEATTRAAADTAESSARTSAVNSLQTALDAEIATRLAADTAETTARTDGDAAIQTELNATQVGAGLGVNGDYTAPGGSNYLGTAVSLADATVKLDAAVKTASDAAAASTADKVSKAGDSMTGNLVMEAGTNITLTDTPISELHAVNKAFVEARLNGLSWKQNVELTTTGNISLVDTIAQTIDGVLVADGDRVLVKNQSIASENGIYVFTAGVGFARATDADEPTELSGAAVLVRVGTDFSNTSWTCPLDSTALVGTDPITFVQHNGASGIVPGIGMSKTGNQLDINLGAGIGQLPSDEVGIDVRPSGALFLTTDGTSDSTDTTAQLAIRTDGSSLITSASGIKVADAGIDSAQLAAGVAGAGLTGGAGAALAVNVGAGILISGDQVILDGSVVDAKVATETTRAQGVETSLQGEVDATQVGAGLASNGDYAANVGANYISTAVSLKDADNKLDTAIKVNADAITAESSARTSADSTLNTAINGEISRATAAESNLQTSITNEVNRAQTAEAGLDTRLDSLEANSGAGAEALKTSLNSGRFNFTSSGAALVHTITHNLNTAYYTIQVMVADAGGVYRNDIVPVEEVDPLNSLKVTLTEARNIKVSVVNNAPLA